MAFQDVFVWMAVLLVFGLVVAVAFVVSQAFWDVSLFAENTTIGSTTIQPAVFVEDALSIFDWLFIVFATVLTIALFVSAFTLPSHPVYAIVGFIMALCWVWVSPYFSNVWLELMEMPLFTGFEASFPFITTFLSLLPTIGFFVGVAGSIIFYGKASSGGF